MSVLIFKKDSPFECTSPTLKIAPSRGNTVYGTHKAIYQDISIVKFINQAKFSVHLVRSNVTKRNYAMKVFPHEDDQPHLYYVNQTRFASLQHPNVTKSLFFEKKRSAQFDGVPTDISYMIMEHAQNGDLLDFLRLHHAKIDDTLARTFFRSLIFGLEYLHNNEVAHLDIKLDNLLLTNDYTLKIADFDVAHFAEDAIIISKGTRLYRSPEIAQGKCTDPKTADIYSAGIVLFILKSQGVFPFVEEDTDEDVDFAELMKRNVGQFWDMHKKVQKKDNGFFDRDFRDLFIGMTKEDPLKRLTIEKIKQSNWFNGPVYDNEEIKEIFGRCL